MKRVAVVVFDEESEYPAKKNVAREYEYLLPDDAPESPTWVVVRATAHTESIDLASHMKIVRVKAVRTVADSYYEGVLKPVVAAFTTDWWKEELDRAKKRASLLAKIERKVSERSKIAQLEALLGEDAEARELLEEFKSLG